MDIQVKHLGPFLKGVADAANETLDLAAVLKHARNTVFNGLGRLVARPGTQLAMTLKDDGGGPANVTSILAIVPFSDGALAVAHSTITQKFYLYRFDADLTGWYNAASAFQANLNAQPVGVLWAAAAAPAPVFIAEGLGEAFIAHGQAGITFRSKRYSVAGGILNLDANLNGGGVVQTFFRGLVSFQQHLWGWGYGSETGGENDRPELLRFGLPIFGTSGGGYFAQADSITVGHRVRSYRERVTVAIPAGEVLYVGTPESLWPVTGYGRNSWNKPRALDESFGIAGPRAGVDAGGVLYYWSRRGPMRVSGLNPPEPLWDRLADAARGVVDPANIVAVFDPDHDQVMWLYRNQTSGRISTLAAFDVEREVLLGPDGDIGLGIFCAGLVQPTGAAGPAAPPNTPSTTGIGANAATANLVAGDASAGTTTIWEYRKQGALTWIIAAETDATQVAYQFTGLLKNTAHEWRAKHRKNGQESIYLGPVAGTQFVTANFLSPPSGCALQTAFDNYQDGSYTEYLRVSWVNSGDGGVSTEVYIKGPVAPPPGSGTLDIVATLPEGWTSYYHTIGDNLNPPPPGNYYAEVRHVKAGMAPSAFSNMPVLAI